MRKSLDVLIKLLLGLAVLPGFAQEIDSALHVKAFPGVDVGQKMTAAMASCPAAPIPCILVLDPSLAAFPAGSPVALCSTCSIADWRFGSIGTLPSAATLSVTVAGDGSISIGANSAIVVLGSTPLTTINSSLTAGAVIELTAFFAGSDLTIATGGNITVPNSQLLVPKNSVVALRLLANGQWEVAAYPSSITPHGTAQVNTGVNLSLTGSASGYYGWSQNPPFVSNGTVLTAVLLPGTAPTSCTTYPTALVLDCGPTFGSCSSPVTMAQYTFTGLPSGASPVQMTVVNSTVTPGDWLAVQASGNCTGSFGFNTRLTY